MNILGLEIREVNGIINVLDGEGFNLMDKIEVILTNAIILSEKKHLVILDLLKATERHVLHEAYKLYHLHSNSLVPSITDRDRAATAKVMHLISSVLA
jgi:hypothetical protein